MRYFIIALLLAFVSGCVSNSASTCASMQPGHQECLVCKKNVDLACVDVKVDDKTPTAQYNGKTYYFCSDECHDQFVKNPEKYVSQK